ncbi:MAG: hypothetical protein V1793_02555 [Pseudomonadota bacterium]
MKTLFLVVCVVLIMGETDPAAEPISGSQNNSGTVSGSVKVYVDPETGKIIEPGPDQAAGFPSRREGTAPSGPLEVIVNEDGSKTIYFPENRMIDEKIEVTPEGKIKPAD